MNLSKLSNKALITLDKMVQGNASVNEVRYVMNEFNQTYIWYAKEHNVFDRVFIKWNEVFLQELTQI